MSTKELLVYRNVAHQDLYDNMTLVMEQHDRPGRDLRDAYLSCVNQLLEMAGQYGFKGNLWHSAIAFLIANAENTFSKGCEITGFLGGSLKEIVLLDFRVMRQWFAFDLHCLDDFFSVQVADVLQQYTADGEASHVFNKRIRDRIGELAIELAGAETEEAFFAYVVRFYQEYGVGKLGLHKAFRIIKTPDGKAEIAPITCTEHAHLEQLIGYERQKKKLVDNTRDFVEGIPANNALLFGDAGTGKSSCIKAVLNDFYDDGLRMIEVYKHQFQDLPEIIAQIKNRKYKFIIYMDDLSFEEYEIEYKYLKAVIEGGLERKPDNVLIYATSNRRHLIRESFDDTKDYNVELHTSDTVQEKLSLVARFGVTIYFGAPDKFEFQTIVKALAERAGLSISEEELYAEANKWELSHGGLSGRTAVQFIHYCLGQRK